MLQRFNCVLLHDTLPVDLQDLWPSDILILAFLVFNPGDLYYLGYKKIIIIIITIIEQLSKVRWQQAASLLRGVDCILSKTMAGAKTRWVCIVQGTSGTRSPLRGVSFSTVSTELQDSSWLWLVHSAVYMPPFFTRATLCWREYWLWPCVCDCPSVCHKSVFYRKKWADWSAFWLGGFFRPVLHCDARKFGYVQK